MTTVTLTTELQAVNTMLSCIGEAPVSSLSTSGLEDVATAKLVLDEISREVQQRDWKFNSEEKYPLIRDSIAGTITLPENTLEVTEYINSSDLEVVQRGLRLYDRKNHTYVFPRDLQANIKFLLAWDELPQAARQYIGIRAARVFQGRNFGSDTKHKFSEDQEMQALVNLQSHEGITGNYNMLRDSMSAFQVIER